MRISLDHKFPVLSAERVLDGICTLLHEKAREELKGNDNCRTYNAVRDWLLKRFEALNIGQSDFGELVLNPYSETNRLGLQSVSVQVVRPKIDEGGAPDEILLADEFKHPTIGVITSGLMGPEVKMTRAEFKVDSGAAEDITALSSDGILLDGEDSGNVKKLPAGSSVLVTAPSAVRTYLEMKDASPEAIIDIIHHGVYACCYLKNSG